MAEWNEFPMWCDRPTETRQFLHCERAVLEMTIARQVSDLLSRHGKIIEYGLDTTPGSEAFEEIKTFHYIAMDEFPLEDGGDLIVDQLPFIIDDYCTKAGAHSVQKDNENGDPILNLTVWDPAVKCWKRRIHDETGSKVGLPVLQELYEALSVQILQIEAAKTSNAMYLPTANFPVPKIEPSIQALVTQFKL